jgi:hypothetical protein
MSGRFGQLILADRWNDVTIVTLALEQLKIVGSFHWTPRRPLDTKDSDDMTRTMTAQFCGSF